MSNYLPAPLPEDEVTTTHLKATVTIGQTLQLTRDGYYKKVVLDSVDVDIDTMVPYYSVMISNGPTISVTTDCLSEVGEEILS